MVIHRFDRRDLFFIREGPPICCPVLGTMVAGREFITADYIDPADYGVSAQAHGLHRPVSPLEAGIKQDIHNREGANPRSDLYVLNTRVTIPTRRPPPRVTVHAA
jgi:hypothetical protein